MQLPEDISELYTFKGRFITVGRKNLPLLSLNGESLNKSYVMKTISKEGKSLSHKNRTPETDILLSIGHENIVQVLTTSTDDMYDYLVFEKLSGNLRRYHIFKDMHFESDESYSYLSQIASALTYLHEDEKIIHRDIKPENMLIDFNNKHGEFFSIKLCDFGFSVRVNNVSKRDKLIGTLDFISPECIGVSFVSSITNDVWALGCCYYEWVTGTGPFYKLYDKDTYKAIVSEEADYTHCNDDERFLLKQMLMKNPKTRITAKLLDTMLNKSDNNKDESQALFCTFEWYTRAQKYESHGFEKFEDIWNICHLDDCQDQENFELEKDGRVSFRSGEWIVFPHNSGSLNATFLKFCKEKCREKC